MQQAGDRLDRDDSEGSKARHTAMLAPVIELRTPDTPDTGLLHTFSHQHRLHLVLATTSPSPDTTTREISTTIVLYNFKIIYNMAM